MSEFNIDEYDFRMSLLESLKTCFKNGDIRIELKEDRDEYTGFLYSNYVNVEIDGEVVYSQRVKPIKM